MAEDADPLSEAYNRGLAAERSGDLNGAAVAYRDVLRLDPADHGGASVRLAAIGHGPVPDKAPDAYVATLFDQHAAAFDDILVGQLRYRVPVLLAARLRDIAPGPYLRMLDLGCGTGLAGQALRDLTAQIIGVDLAEEMVALADARGAYDQLFVGEAVQFLAEEEEHCDLIVATDVLPYIGDLAPLVDALAGCIAPGGLIAMSSETAGEDRGDWVVGPGHRFAHSGRYIRALLATRDFEILAFDPITVRLEQETPAPGHLIVARMRA